MKVELIMDLKIPLTMECILLNLWNCPQYNPVSKELATVLFPIAKLYIKSGIQWVLRKRLRQYLEVLPCPENH